MYLRALLEAVGRPGFDPRRIGVGKHSGTAVLADILGVVADQPVALANDAVLELAGRRELEAFLDAALGLELGHFRLLVAPLGRDVIQPPRHACWPGHWFFQRSGKRGAILAPPHIGKEASRWNKGKSRGRAAGSRHTSLSATARPPKRSSSTSARSAPRS